MILKHRDTDVLRFDWVEPFGVKNVEVNSAAERFLPLSFRDQAREDMCFADIFFFDAIIFNTDRHLGNFGFLVDNDVNELAGIAPIFDNGYSLFSQAISEPGVQDNEFKDLRKFLARVEPKLYEHWLDIPGGVTDEMIDRLKELGKFEFAQHPDFIMPDNRLEVIQYFLQNRIAKIIRYRGKADRYLSIRRKNDTINPMLSDKLLKKAKEAENLRNELKATMKSFPRARIDKLAILFKTSEITIKRYIKTLQEAGELKRVGSRKTGYWQVIEKAEELKEAIAKPRTVAASATSVGQRVGCYRACRGGRDGTVEGFAITSKG